jgi:hypothetical protein
MRRLLALLAAILVLAAFHSSDPIFTADGKRVHWLGGTRTNRERQIDVIVPANYMTDINFADAMRHAVAQGDRSPYINLTLRTPTAAPTDCPTTHCIVVYRAPMNGGVASMGWDSKGHMYGKAVTVGLDSAPWDRATLFNAACHEIAGHGLGLGHSSDGTQGPCQFNLTSWDLGLINEAHQHADIHGKAKTRAQLEQQHGELKIHVERHTRGFYERLAHQSG